MDLKKICEEKLKKVENQIKNRSNPVSIPYNKKTNISKVLVDEFLKLTIR